MYIYIVTLIGFLSISTPQNTFSIAFCNFANSLNTFGLSDIESGLFSALVLLTDRNNRLDTFNHKHLIRCRERVAEALRVQIVRTRPESAATALQMMPALEAKIAELRALGAMHVANLEWLRANWTRVQLPPLFAEIFDIPKTDDLSPEGSPRY